MKWQNKKKKKVEIKSEVDIDILISNLEDAVWRMNWQTIKLYRLNKGFKELGKDTLDAYRNFLFYSGKITAYLYVLDGLGRKDIADYYRNLRGQEWANEEAGQFQEKNLPFLAGLKYEN